MSDATLWETLARAGLVRGDMPPARESQAPWYVRVMLGTAGVIAAIFLIAFFALGFELIVKSPAAAAVIGAALIGGAYALFRQSPHGDFAPMFALAISIAGQALFVYGFGDAFLPHSTASVAALIAVIEAGLALVMPNYIHKVASACAAGIAFAAAAGVAGAGFVAPGLIAAAYTWLWLNEARLAKAHTRVTPIAYGLTLSFICVEATGIGLFGAGGFRYMNPGMPHVAAEQALVAIVLVAAVVALVRRAGWNLRERPALIAVLAAAAVGLASLPARGVSGGLAIIVLGFAAGNTVLWGLGVAALLFQVFAYYYILDLTLLEKAVTLAVVGALLLASRYLVLKRVLPHA